MCRGGSTASRLSKRGAGLILVFMSMLGIMSSGLLIQHEVAYFKGLQKEREQRGRQAVRRAREALLSYMLLRAESNLEIANGTTASTKPRWLMLPCPDNIGDQNLDGTQEGSCRALPPSGVNLVNDILKGGSRFGRLPWRTRNINAVSHSLNDGINADVHDMNGSRLWYALSRNMAPAQDDVNIPLNLHRLMTHDKEWLTVVNQDGNIISDQVAAVILAPGPAMTPRPPESALETADDLDYNGDVRAAGGRLAPERYFESYRAPDGNRFSNYNKDGVFIKAPEDETQGFNDTVDYIALEELANGRHFFLRSYERLVGVGKVHNAPSEDRSLAKIRRALDSYYALFGFYPPPARRATAAHLSTRQRHCAVYHSGDMAHAATLAAGTTLAAAAAVTVQAAAGAGLQATVTLMGQAAFLLQHHAVAASSLATIIYEDVSLAVATLTMARYARVSLTVAALGLVEDGLQSLAATIYQLSAAAPVVLLSAATITVMPQTPLHPVGDMIGWLSEHELPYRRAGNDGDKFTLQGAARAMFLSAARLTSGMQTITAAGGDLLTLAAYTTLRLEKDFHQAQLLDAEVFYQEGETLTAHAVLPDAATYNKRQFAVWLLADAYSRFRKVSAPAVLFPWRKKIKSHADSRDNLHAYPPCFDARNFYDRRFRAALEDQSMVYAVAAACTYGGDPAACGRRAGFTVSLAAGAALALPRAFTLTHTYTATLGNLATISLYNGIVQNTIEASLYKAVTFPVLDGGGDQLAAFRLPPGYRFIPGLPVTLTAGATLIGGMAAVLERVPALLIYSPAPLPRVACASGGMPLSGVQTAVVPPLTLANQRVAAEDITNLCYWLDDEENADGDGLFVIYGEETRRGVSQRNDYFVLFDGQLRVGG